MFRALPVMALCALATTVGAQEYQHWGEAGRWTIQIDTTNGNGCLMETKTEDGTVIQFGTVPNKNGGFFAAYHPEWTDIEDGEAITVKFDFDKKRFSGDAIGSVRGDLYGGYAFFDNPNVPMEFAKNNTMTVIGSKGRSIEVDLAGTTKAIAAAQKCQAEQPK